MYILPQAKNFNIEVSNYKFICSSPNYETKYYYVIRKDIFVKGSFKT